MGTKFKIKIFFLDINIELDADILGSLDAGEFLNW